MRALPSAEEGARVIQLTEALADTDVDLLLCKHGEEGLTEANLRRWLTARKWNVEHARRSLVAHAAWRAEFCPDGRVLEAEIPNHLSHNKAFLQGRDRHGCCLCLLLMDRHKGDMGGLEVGRFFVYGMDAMIASADPIRNPTGLVTGILDFEGFGLKNVDLPGLKNMFHMLQEHYVERLSVLYFYEAPYLFHGLWNLVAPLIDPITREKVKFVYKKDAAEVFSQRFDAQVLPEKYGGRAALLPVQQAVASMQGETPQG